MFYECSLQWDKVFFFCFSPSGFLKKLLNIVRFVSIQQSFVFVTVTRSVSESSFQPDFIQTATPQWMDVCGGGLRLPAGRPGSVLPTGCSWRSTRASRRSPSLAVRGCPRTPRAPPSPRAPPAPRTPAPPQLRGRKRKQDIKIK